MLSRTLEDVIRGYLTSRSSGTDDKYISNLISTMQNEANGSNITVKMDLVQQLIYLNLCGFDVSWGDFTILEIMSIDNFSAKRIAYSAASQIWNSKSDVAFMATQCIQRDLTSVQSAYASIVLTSLPPYLSSNLASNIAQNVISLMTSSRPVVRQKAIMTFYHVCLKFPAALRPGFATLVKSLDDSDPSVVYSALTVMNELCAHNPKNFLNKIPQFFNMLTQSTSNWVTLRLINLLHMLCSVEPRLSKKLVGQFTTILETTNSITVLFECVRTIVDIPIKNANLLNIATMRLEQFLEHQDHNLRFLCLSLFIKLLSIMPKLVAQHRDLIESCLSSNDESIRLLALDLLSALVNKDTIDRFLEKILQYFQESNSTSFRNQLLTRIMTVCEGKDDDLYPFIYDFEWYLESLTKFISEGNFTCFSELSSHIKKLSKHVPAIRPRLCLILSEFFSLPFLKDATDLLLTASNVIKLYAGVNPPTFIENSSGEVEEVEETPDAETRASLDRGLYECFSKMLTDKLLLTPERVQLACLSNSFVLFLRSSGDLRRRLSSLLNDRLEIFHGSPSVEVQDRSSFIAQLSPLFLSYEDDGPAVEFANLISTSFSKSKYVPERPPEFADPLPAFDPPSDDDDDVDLSYLAGNSQPSPNGQRQTKQKPIIKKTGPTIRVQNTSGARMAVIKGSKKTKASPTQKSPGALNTELGQIDLFDQIAEDELQRIQGPKPYSQEELSKQAEENALLASRKHRHSRQHRQHRQQVERPKREEKEVEIKPQPKSRAQALGENGSMLVTAVEFSPSNNPRELEVELEVHNQTGGSLGPIDIEVAEFPKGAKIVSAEVPRIQNPIRPGEVIRHKIKIEIEEIKRFQMVKLLFIPTDAGGETLEARLRIFPSYFLDMPKENVEIGEVSRKCQCAVELKPEIKEGGRVVLQTLVNLLRGGVVLKKEKERVIYAKSSLGDEVVCTVKADTNSTSIELKCSDQMLLNLLSKEVEAAFKLLNKG